MNDFRLLTVISDKQKHTDTADTTFCTQLQ